MRQEDSDPLSIRRGVHAPRQQSSHKNTCAASAKAEGRIFCSQEADSPLRIGDIRTSRISIGLAHPRSSGCSEGMTSNRRSLVLRGFTLVELMVVIAIIGLLVSVLATSVVSRYQDAKHELDKKTVQDIFNQLQIKYKTDKRARQKILQDEAIKTARGREFYEAMFRVGIFEAEHLGKMASTSSDDLEQSATSLDDLSTFRLDELSCSWAGPQANELGVLLRLKGARRRVVMCSNSRNFHTFDGEVITMLSDGSIANYIFLEDVAEWGWEITEEQWADPVSMFGKVKPFDGVYD